MSGYFQNFVGFKSRTIPPGVAAAEVKYDSWSVFGDNPNPPATDDTTDDTPGDTADDPTGPRRANAFTQRWGDNTSYQVGNNYTELEGDAVTVAYGNSSAKRIGWTNNYTEGPTFTTQIGGTFATSLFNVATIFGIRVNTFVGFDVNMSLSLAKFSIAGGTDWKIDKVGKVSLTPSEWTLNDSEASFATNVKKVVGDSLTTLSNQIEYVSLYQNLTATNLITKVMSLETKATEIDQKFANMKSVGVACTFDTAQFKVTAAGCFEVSGLVIKLG
jgi:hypothetical protein